MTQTQQILKLVEENKEWLSTTEGDEVECISVENLESILKQFFNEE